MLGIETLDCTRAQVQHRTISPSFSARFIGAEQSCHASHALFITDFDAEPSWRYPRGSQLSR
jgi:hypothetical protein